MATWDFGDGSAPVTVAVGSSGIVSTPHQHFGETGKTFTAQITVTDAAIGEKNPALYPIVMREESLDTEVNVAVDEGLWRLYQLLQTSRYDARATALATLAFERNGHLESGDPSDPYTQAVAVGVHVLLASRANDRWTARALHAADVRNAIAVPAVLLP